MMKLILLVACSVYCGYDKMDRPSSIPEISQSTHLYLNSLSSIPEISQSTHNLYFFYNLSLSSIPEISQSTHLDLNSLRSIPETSRLTTTHASFIGQIHSDIYDNIECFRIIEEYLCSMSLPVYGVSGNAIQCFVKSPFSPTILFIRNLEHYKAASMTYIQQVLAHIKTLEESSEKVKLIGIYDSWLVYLTHNTKYLL